MSEKITGASVTGQVMTAADLDAASEAAKKEAARLAREAQTQRVAAADEGILAVFGGDEQAVAKYFAKKAKAADQAERQEIVGDVQSGVVQCIRSLPNMTEEDKTKWEAGSHILAAAAAVTVINTDLEQEQRDNAEYGASQILRAMAYAKLNGLTYVPAEALATFGTTKNGGAKIVRCNTGNLKRQLNQTMAAVLFTLKDAKPKDLTFTFGRGDQKQTVVLTAADMLPIMDRDGEQFDLRTCLSDGYVDFKAISDGVTKVLPEAPSKGGIAD